MGGEDSKPPSLLLRMTDDRGGRGRDDERDRDRDRYRTVLPMFYDFFKSIFSTSHLPHNLL
jgi:hypothetical protein